MTNSELQELIERLGGCDWQNVGADKELFLAREGGLLLSKARGFNPVFLRPV